MAHVILVHGMAATDKSWFDIPERLADSGHTVDPILLPGDPWDGLGDFTETVKDALPTSGSAVLIGHSLGGMSISQAASDAPSQVAKLIYVAALVPKHLERAGGIMLGLGTSLDSVEDEFERLGIDGSHPARRPPVIGALVGAFRDRGSFAAMPKHYVRCADDTMVRPEKQAEMIAKWTGTTESELATGHIPQKEAPESLTAQLLAAIG